MVLRESDMGRKIKEEKIMLADEVELIMKIDVFDGELCDTEIQVDGSFWVEGSNRKAFAEKMEALVNEYQI